MTTTSSATVIGEIKIFERNTVVGGRKATVTISRETFETGASILHPKNHRAMNFTKLLNLKIEKPSLSSESIGIWDGKGFVFKTFKCNSKIPLVHKVVDLTNSFKVFVHIAAQNGVLCV